MDTDHNILNLKLELIQWLSRLEDVSIINKIIDLRKSEDKDWWNSLSENEKQAIDKGIEDAESGKLNPQSEVRKLYEKWL